MIFDIDNYVISDDASIKQALKKIEDNHLGFVFTGNGDGKLSGLATDGDIRRALLNGAGIEESISKFVVSSKNVSVFISTSVPSNLT